MTGPHVPTPRDGDEGKGPTDGPPSEPIPPGLLDDHSLLLAVIRRQLLRYVGKRFRASNEECEDLVSEIMAVMVQGVTSGHFRGRDLRSFNAYIYGIARLKIMQAVERAGRRHELSQHLCSGDVMIRPFTNPETRAIRTDLLKQIYDGMDPRCRELMEYKFIQGWSDQELADFKGISKNAVSTALSRCLERARKLKPIAEILYQ